MITILKIDLFRRHGICETIVLNLGFSYKKDIWRKVNFANNDLK